MWRTTGTGWEISRRTNELRALAPQLWDLSNVWPSNLIEPEHVTVTNVARDVHKKV